MLSGSLLLEGSFLQSCLPLSNRTNIKTMDMHTCILRNGVKTEMLSPQNDCTRQNVNFLLATTVTTVVHAIVNKNIHSD